MKKRTNEPYGEPAPTMPVLPSRQRQAWPPEPQRPPAWPPPQPPPPVYRPAARRRPVGCAGCLAGGCLSALLLLVVVAAYFLAPLRTTFLILGIDRVPDGSAVGRSDTMILTSVEPLKPEVHMLSIPRDLWVEIPGVGEQRINTAHFFAEAAEAGSGPAVAAQTVEQNFEVPVPYWVRIRFDGFTRVIDALGGVTVDLPEEMAGYPAGQHHLDSAQALAFVRDRKGTDDFFRMSRGQLMIRAVVRQALQPASWRYWPAVARAAGEAIDTNLPFWQWPRLGLALARSAGGGIDSRSVGRDQVTPFTTEGGADVLLPNWDQIRPVVREMFQ